MRLGLGLGFLHRLITVVTAARNSSFCRKLLITTN